MQRAQESKVLFRQRAGIGITHGHLNACCAHLNIVGGKFLIPHFAGKSQLRLQGDGDRRFWSNHISSCPRGTFAGQGPGQCTGTRALWGAAAQPTAGEESCQQAQIAEGIFN